MSFSLPSLKYILIERKIFGTYPGHFLCLYLVGIFNFQIILIKVSPFYFLGNALLLAGPPEQFIQTMKTTGEKYGQLGRLHIGTRPNVYVGSCPEAYEKILSSNKQITKVLMKCM